MAPLQGLSRRFWLTHVVDEEAEIKAASRLHVAMLRAILEHDPNGAEQVSQELTNYLVDFSFRSLRGAP
jgi:hypothetical protein